MNASGIIVTRDQYRGVVASQPRFFSKKGEKKEETKLVSEEEPKKVEQPQQGGGNTFGILAVTGLVGLGAYLGTRGGSSPDAQPEA